MWLERLSQDVQYAVRTLMRTPGFTTVAILSLALGIGANTAIFGLLDVILYRMLPIEHPEELRIVSVKWSADVPKPSSALTHPFFRMMRDRNRSFSDLAASATFQWRDKSPAGDGIWHSGQLVSGTYFSLLGVGASLGRVLGPGDDVVEGTGAPDAIPAVLSYRYWQRAFDGDRNVLGREVNLNGAWATVVGVASPGFFGTIVGLSPDVFVPVLAQPSVSPPGNLLHDNPGSTTNWILAYGRLRPGVTDAQAEAELTLTAQQYLLSRHGQDKAAACRAFLEPGSWGLSRLRDRFSEPLHIVMALVGAVLLMACANLANLLLARTAARRQEIAIRLAIGASRTRIIRQLITESMLLAAAGGAIGLAFALWGGGFLIRMLPAGITPTYIELAPDTRILAFTAGVSVLTGLLFGVVPALRETRVGIHGGLKSGSRLDLAGVLVTVQMALAIPLIVGAGLFLSTLRNLVSQETGFLSQKVLQVRIHVRGTHTPQERWPSIYDGVLQNVRAVPGVRSASIALRGVLEQDMTRSGPLGVPGYVFAAGESRLLAESYISSDYFETTGIPLRRGRFFTAHEEQGKAHVAVINETMARRYYAGQDPVGRIYEMGSAPATQIQIVGVVADAVYTDFRQDPVPMAYYPWRQIGTPPLSAVFVRVQGDAGSIEPQLRRAITAIHPDLFLHSSSLEALIDDALFRERILAQLSSLLAGLALLVASAGLYGVLSYGVTRRTRDIGVRVALGARPSTIAMMVLQRAAVMLCAGVAAGLVCSLFVGKLIGSMLYGVRPHDPLATAASVLTLAGISFAAAWFPARRAAGVDPLVALRHE
jgi:predicted permease